MLNICVTAVKLLYFGVILDLAQVWQGQLNASSISIGSLVGKSIFIGLKQWQKLKKTVVYGTSWPSSYFSLMRTCWENFAYSTFLLFLTVQMSDLSNVDQTFPAW